MTKEGMTQKLDNKLDFLIRQARFCKDTGEGWYRGRIKKIFREAGYCLIDPSKFKVLTDEELREIAGIPDIKDRLNVFLPLYRAIAQAQLDRVMELPQIEKEG